MLKGNMKHGYSLIYHFSKYNHIGFSDVLHFSVLEVIIYLQESPGQYCDEFYRMLSTFFLSLRSFSSSHPVSNRSDSLLAYEGKPVTIRAASNCTFSSRSESANVQPSHTSEAYSKVGRINVVYILFRVALDNVYFNFLRTLTCLYADLQMRSICSDHLPFYIRLRAQVFLAIDNI